MSVFLSLSVPVPLSLCSYCVLSLFYGMNGEILLLTDSKVVAGSTVLL